MTQIFRASTYICLSLGRTKEGDGVYLVTNFVTRGLRWWQISLQKLSQGGGRENAKMFTDLSKPFHDLFSPNNMTHHRGKKAVYLGTYIESKLVLKFAQAFVLQLLFSC